MHRHSTNTFAFHVVRNVHCACVAVCIRKAPNRLRDNAVFHCGLFVVIDCEWAQCTVRFSSLRLKAAAQTMRSYFKRNKKDKQLKIYIRSSIDLLPIGNRKIHRPIECIGIDGLKVHKRLNLCTMRNPLMRSSNNNKKSSIEKGSSPMHGSWSEVNKQKNDNKRWARGIKQRWSTSTQTVILLYFNRIQSY